MVCSTPGETVVVHIWKSVAAASEQRGNNLKGFKGFNLRATALTGLYVPHSLDSGQGVTRRGLVSKAHRLFYHSTLGLRVIKKRRRETRRGSASGSEMVMVDIHAPGGNAESHGMLLTLPSEEGTTSKFLKTLT